MRCLIKLTCLKSFKNLFLCLAVLLCSACASDKHPADPLEPMNRSIYGFNRTLDKGYIRPVAYGYHRFMPDPVQIGVSNFFNNLHELPTTANDFLQFKFAYAANDASRFLINSTVGVFGIFDPATKLGLERRDEDFGQTMQKWGIKKSSYLVLPLLGPSTIRDGFGVGVDFFAFTVWPHIDSVSLRNGLLAAKYLDYRVRLLKAEKVLDVAALDEYAFVRDAYFQHREYVGADGVLPEDVNGDGLLTDEWEDVDNWEEEEEI